MFLLVNQSGYKQLPAGTAGTWRIFRGNEWELAGKITDHFRFLF